MTLSSDGEAIATAISPIFPNVHLDRASAHAWHELNETRFLEGVFGHLRQEMGSDFDAYDHYVFSPAKAGVRPASADHSGKKILYYISDESSSEPQALGRSYAAVFKSYLKREMPGSNLFPLGLGYVKNVAPPRRDVPVNARTCDIFFSGNLNANRFPLYRALHPWLQHLPSQGDLVMFPLVARTPARTWFRRDFSGTHDGADRQIYFTGGFRQGLKPAEYAERLGDSKIILCPKGFQSVETFRHVEALRAGAVVVTERLPDTHLYRGGPFVEIDDWREGLRVAEALVRDPERLQHIADAGRGWYADVLSEAATARFIARTIAAIARR